MEIRLKFDKEYSTQYFREIDFLKERGIIHIFKKDVDGVKTFKYEKTPQLFEALRIFYTQNK